MIGQIAIADGVGNAREHREADRFAGGERGFWHDVELPLGRVAVVGG